MLGSIDDAFPDQRGRLTPRQLAAIRAWQRTDRSYELVQGVLRGTLDPATLTPDENRYVETLIADLDRAIESSRVMRRVTVYRGIRSLRATFGVERADEVAAEPAPFKGYTAASIHRAVARIEFSSPAGALLEIELPAGTPTLWVASVGGDRLAYQGEVLLPDRLRLRVAGVRHAGHLPVLSMVVIV